MARSYRRTPCRQATLAFAASEWSSLTRLTERSRPHISFPLQRARDACDDGFNVIRLTDDLDSAGILTRQRVQMLFVGGGEDDVAMLQWAQRPDQFEKRPVAVVRRCNI